MGEGEGEGQGGGAEEEGGRRGMKGAAHICVGQIWNNQLRDLPILQEESSCAEFKMWGRSASVSWRYCRIGGGWCKCPKR